MSQETFQQAQVLVGQRSFTRMHPRRASSSYLLSGDRRNSQGTMPTNRLFTGQRLDGTGLYYYGARYYDPTIGKFISPDTIVQNFADPQSLNRYAYALNNPLKFIDAAGKAAALPPDFSSAPFISDWGPPLTIVETVVNFYSLAVAAIAEGFIDAAARTGADILASAARQNAEQTGTVSFAANPDAGSDTAELAASLPLQKVIEVSPDSAIGFIVNTFLHGAVTLDGTVVTTLDITQPDALG